MLNEISISNFKSLSEVSLKLRPITILIGPNRSGKSGVLQALTCFKQSLGSHDLILDGNFINLGTYQDVVRRGQQRITLKTAGSSIFEESLFPFDTKRVSYAYEATFERGRIVACQSGYNGALDLKSRWSSVEEKERAIEPPKITFRTDASVSLGLNSEVGLPIVISGTSHSPETKGIVEAASRSLQSIISVIREDINRIHLVPAIRGFDQPSFELDVEAFQDFAVAGNPSVQATRAASSLAYNRDLEEKISSWTKRITGVSITVRLVPKRRVVLESTEHKSRINVINEGFGLNQLVYLLAQIAIAPPKSLLLIEDPEIHLHPKAQAELADIFAEIARENKQLLITSHSEHMLFRFLTNVAEKRLAHGDLSVYYFEKNEVTKARELKVNEKGMIEGGLSGFFEADVTELRRYIEALR